LHSYAVSQEVVRFVSKSASFVNGIACAYPGKGQCRSGIGKSKLKTIFIQFQLLYALGSKEISLQVDYSIYAVSVLAAMTKLFFGSPI
jgi:hypothetical protein